MKLKLVLRFEILTPLFMGNADQMAELRPPAFKGLLRFWYRAVHPDGLANEAKIFGGGGQGQSPFFLHLEASDVTTKTADELGLKRGGNANYPGLSYLGYSLPLQNSQRRKADRPIRTGFVPGGRFSLALLFPREPGHKTRKAILAAAWLAGHVGCAGTRANRGFGALSLTDWHLDPFGGQSVKWTEMDALPLLYTRASQHAWKTDFKNILEKFSLEWFDTQNGNSYNHPHLGKEKKIILAKEYFDRQDWTGCLDHMGSEMQKFRLKYPPDADKVKAQFYGKPGLDKSPDRAGFGLPLSFFYKKEKSSLQFLPKTGDRHASLLHLRPVVLNNRLSPLYLRLDGAVPGGPLKGDPQNRLAGTRIEKRNQVFPPFQNNAMDTFLDYIKGADTNA